MGSPLLWFGAAAKLLKDKLLFFNGISVQSGNLNPTVTAVDAEPGSQYNSSLTSAVYVKQDSGLTTNWALLDDSSNEIPSGGDTGQALVKASEDNYDVEWATIPATDISATDLSIVAEYGLGPTVDAQNGMEQLSDLIIAQSGTFATLTGTQTLTNKTLTSPVITSPTGIVKGDVGLGNVPNVDATKTSIGITLGTPGTAIVAGGIYSITVTYGCTINNWTLTAEEAGDIVIDVKKSTYASFPTTASIAGSEKPTLSGVRKNQDLSLGTWTTTVTAGDVIEFVVDSASIDGVVNLALGVTKT